MKTLFNINIILILALVLGACSSSYKAGISEYDDLYYTPRDARMQSEASNVTALNGGQGSLAVPEDELSDYEKYRLSLEGEYLDEDPEVEGSQEEAYEITIDLEGIYRRAVQLTRGSNGVGSYFLSADGQALCPGRQVARIAGPASGILALERVALNFLAHLSGIATLTNKFFGAVQGTRAVICDTRKTIPGLRTLEKYAVRAGGGSNHRLGLFDSAMIKDNHLLSLTSDPSSPDHFAVLSQRLPKLRTQLPPGGFIQLEVDDLPQFQQVLDLHLDLDMVLLDNFSLAQLTQAVKLCDQAGLADKLLLEASGNITLGNVKQVARSGVERISVGALTHSAPAFDFSMEFIQK